MLCPLCREQSAHSPPAESRTFEVECTNCGHYRITLAAHQALAGNDALAFEIGAWVYLQNQSGSTPRIETTTLEWIKTYPRPTTKKRAELYLGRAIRLLDNKLIGRIQPSLPALRVASWSFDNNDAVALANYLGELGAFDGEVIGNERRLTAKAHILYEEMIGQRSSSSQAFVAMWFDAAMKVVYDAGISKAISACGYEPLRVDRKEHGGKIDDQIIAEIRRSAFMVADFTGHRGGVYYEAGFAHGLGRHVIFTCRKDDIKHLHFDVRQYNTIPWQSPADIIIPLQNRILAMFGAGPLNPDAKPIPLPEG